MRALVRFAHVAAGQQLRHFWTSYSYYRSFTTIQLRYKVAPHLRSQLDRLYARLVSGLDRLLLAVGIKAA